MGIVSRGEALKHRVLLRLGMGPRFDDGPCRLPGDDIYETSFEESADTRAQRVQKMVRPRLQRLLADASPYLERLQRLASTANARLRRNPKVRRTLPLVVGTALILCICGIAVGGSSTRVGGPALPVAHVPTPTTASIGSLGLDGGRGGGTRSTSRAGRGRQRSAPPSLFADPFSHLSNQEKELVSKAAASEGANENVDFDANGKRKRRDSDFVAYNHKPEEIVDKSMVAAAAIKASLKSGDGKSSVAGGSAAGGGAAGGGAAGGDGGGKAPSAGNGAKGKPAQPQQPQQPKKSQQTQPPPPPKPKPQPQQQERIEMAHLPADVSVIKARFKNRKFLLPLLDQGPNNQFLQMRVALAKAHSMNRTLVLPVWLPHNPKFQHFHPGAPNVPSRDKKLDQISYPFESTFDPQLLSRFVRTIDLAAFRLLTDGHVELCWAESKASHDQALFDSYLRLSGVVCDKHTSAAPSKESLMATRYLGYHSYDHEIGNRDRYYEYLRWAPAITRHADALQAALFNGSEYVAAHIRLADAHWEHTDCNHTINGVRVPSVSCGDGQNVINYTSLAQEMWHVLRQADKKLLYVATNMECSDVRLARMSKMLEQRAVRTVCAQEQARQEIGSDDNYFLSVVEQELCARAHTFIGSKYSTWTDTVSGMRIHEERPGNQRPGNNWLFEELYQLGVK